MCSQRLATAIHYCGYELNHVTPGVCAQTRTAGLKPRGNKETTPHLDAQQRAVEQKVAALVKHCVWLGRLCNRSRVLMEGSNMLKR